MLQLVRKGKNTLEEGGGVDCACLQPPALEISCTPSFSYNVGKLVGMQGYGPYGYILVLEKGCARKKNQTSCQ